MQTNFRRLYCWTMTLSKQFSEVIRKMPRLSVVHPYVSEMWNLIYDRDHYKVSLGQLAFAKVSISRAFRDTVRTMGMSTDPHYKHSCMRRYIAKVTQIVKKTRYAVLYLIRASNGLAQFNCNYSADRTIIVAGADGSDLCERMNMSFTAGRFFVNKGILHPLY